MSPTEKIQAYCKDVCGQLRWKEARPMVAQEICAHLCDQRDAYTAQGMCEDAATQEALRQMGDPAAVGRQLDRIHRPRAQWAMLALACLFMAIGLGTNWLINTLADSPVPAARLAGAYAAALAVLLCCRRINFAALGRHAIKVYALMLCAAVSLVLCSGTVNGSAVWRAGPLQLQLACFAIVFPLAFSLFVYAMRGRGRTGVLLCAAAWLAPAALLRAVPAWSGLALYTGVCMAVFCFAAARGWFGIAPRRRLPGALLPIASALGAVSALGVFCAVRSPGGLRALRAGTADMETLQALVLQALSGTGAPGGAESAQLLTSLLPYIRTSYPLLYLSQRFGAAVAVLIVLAMALFAVLGVRKALREKSMLGSLLALSTALTFALQTAFYMLGTMRFGLIAPLSLPFISYGSTSLLLNAALVGLMLSVFRSGEAVRDREVRVEGCA